jgi:aminomuconate-semialdehyde/2-hydroxymuconate-6-semialdehyde dehydrogenase
MRFVSSDGFAERGRRRPTPYPEDDVSSATSPVSTSQVTHLIDGAEVPSADGRVLENINPWTRVSHGSVARGGAAEAAAAVAAARRAFDEGPWPRMREAERAEVLRRLADLVDAHAAELADADALDMGRPAYAARGFDVPRTSAMFRFFAEHVAVSTSETYPMGAGTHAFTAYRPAGVVLAISPWNLPLVLGSWKAAPALAWGNTVVWKPAEDSPTSAFLLACLAREAGLPDGVLNVVQGLGSEVGAHLLAEPGIDRIAFTGSTLTGRLIGRAAGERLIPVSLELGGKGATIVFPDADLELAAATAARAVFNNSGQVCLAGARLILHDSIYDDFLARLIDHARELTVGDPMAPSTDLGPLASEKQYDRVLGYFEQSERDGGRVEIGGPAGGWAFAPTIVTGLPQSSVVNHEEIFGPIATAARFGTMDEALTLANDTAYGLSAVVFTESISRAHTVASALRTGTVWVNCYQVRDLRAPFGGRGESGIGREGGAFSREFYSEPQAVFLNTELPAP